jgi:hypothetical protein
MMRRWRYIRNVFSNLGSGATCRRIYAGSRVRSTAFAFRGCASLPRAKLAAETPAASLWRTSRSIHPYVCRRPSSSEIRGSHPVLA